MPEPADPTPADDELDVRADDPAGVPADPAGSVVADDADDEDDEDDADDDEDDGDDADDADDADDDGTGGGSGRGELWRRVGLLVLAVVLAQALVTAVFAWPQAKLELHGVPMVVVGQNDIGNLARTGVEVEAGPGRLKVSQVPDEAAGRRAVLNRDAYAALVVGDDGLRLIIARAASPTAASSIYGILQRIQARGQGTALTVDDVAPLPDRDQRGTVFAAGLFVLLVAAAAGGALIWLRSKDVVERLVTLGALALASGLVGAVTLHYGLGALRGPIWAEATAIAFGALAVSATMVAFGVAANEAGLGLGALLLVAVAYPISGATTAPELVPAPWNALGPWLPAGALSTTLRGAAFFGGAGTITLVAFAVLAAWVLVGLAGTLAPEGVTWWRERRRRAAELRAAQARQARAARKVSASTARKASASTARKVSASTARKASIARKASADG